MASQTDSEFRSVAITETSRNVVCLILKVFKGVDCLVLVEALSSFMQNGKSPKVGITQPCTSSGEMISLFSRITEPKLLTLYRFPELTIQL